MKRLENLDNPWHLMKLPDVGRIASQSWQGLVIEVHPDIDPQVAFDLVEAAMRDKGWRRITSPLPEYGVNGCLFEEVDDRVQLSIDDRRLVFGRSWPPDIPDTWTELGFPPKDWTVTSVTDDSLTATRPGGAADAMDAAVEIASRAGFAVTEPPSVADVGGAGVLAGPRGTLRIGVVRLGEFTMLTLGLEP